MSDYENMQCAASLICAGDGGDRGIEGLCASVDKLAAAVATQNKLLLVIAESLLCHAGDAVHKNGRLLLTQIVPEIFQADNSPPSGE